LCWHSCWDTLRLAGAARCVQEVTSEQRKKHCPCHVMKAVRLSGFASVELMFSYTSVVVRCYLVFVIPVLYARSLYACYHLFQVRNLVEFCCERGGPRETAVETKMSCAGRTEGVRVFLFLCYEQYVVVRY
jgi:hypothetical protein